MNKRRLLKLALLLEADAKKRKGLQFDLGTWGLSYEGGMAVSCNTKACAMGLAALSGAFKRDGLTYEVVPRFIEDPTLGSRINISFNGRGLPINAAKRLFEITAPQAEWLFLPDSYEDCPVSKKGERIVAKRIRDFVAGKATP